MGFGVKRGQERRETGEMRVLGRQPGFEVQWEPGLRAEGREPEMLAGAGQHPVVGLAAAKESAPQCACANRASLGQFEVVTASGLEATPAAGQAEGAQSNRAMLGAGVASTSRQPFLLLPSAPFSGPPT